MSDEMENGSGRQDERKRSLTVLTLEWLAEKIRRSEKLKEDIRSGSYQVDSEKLAARLANKD